MQINPVQKAVEILNNAASQETSNSEQAPASRKRKAPEPGSIKPARVDRQPADSLDPSKDKNPPDDPGSDAPAPDVADRQGAQKDAGEGGEGEQGTPADSELPEKVSLEEIAKHLDIDAKDLYEMHVPLAGGKESISLGEMKDKFATWSAQSERLSQVEKLAQEQQQSMQRDLKTVEALAELIPAFAQDQRVISQVNQYLAQKSGQEFQRLMTVNPSWKNPDYAIAQRQAMIDTAKEYGLTDSDVGSIVDHRWILALQDLAGLKAKISEASSFQQKIAKPGAKSAPKQNPNPIQKGKLAAKLRERAKAGDHRAQMQLATEILNANSKR